MSKNGRLFLAAIAVFAFVLLGCGAMTRASEVVATLIAPTPAAPAAAAATAPTIATATPLPLALGQSTTGAQNASVPAAVAPVFANDSTQLIDAAGLDFAERRTINVYQRVSPSVVFITTQVMMRDFFNVVPEEGAGSGFVLDKDGHILTNYHVVEGAQQISVSFSGSEDSLPATVVGQDPGNDLAVLHVDAPADTLQPVELGTSSDLQVGQWAIAIGNPFGQFDRTLTTGVISALNRTLDGSNGRTITGVIQTDAAINKGNSGGPLLDSSGRVIGINSAIFSPTGSNAGVGFAVPVDTIKRVLPDLLSLGHYRHPSLGVASGYSLNASLAQALSLPVDSGVLIVQLTDGGPLAAQGVRGAQQQVYIGNQRAYVGGDILVSVDGQPVTAVDMLDAWLETNHQVGDTVTVQINRDGSTQEMQVTLGEDAQ